MLSALLLQPKVFSIYCPHFISVSHKGGFPLVFLIALHKEFLPPTQPHFLPPFSSQQPPTKRLGFSPSWCMGLLLLSLGGWRCEEAGRAPAQTRWLPETWQESCIPFSETFCKADRGTWGRSGPHLLSFGSRGGSAAGPLPHSLFWHDTGRACCCPTQRWSSCLGWLYQMPKMGRLSRTETGSAIRKIRALSTLRDGFGCSVPGSRTQPS